MSNRHGMPEHEQGTNLTPQEWTKIQTERQMSEKVRTSTTPSHLVREEPTHGATYTSNLSTPIVRSRETPTTQLKRTHQNPESESSYALMLRMFFDSVGWQYREEWLIEKTGKYIDFLVKAPYDGGHIFFGIECKKDINEQTDATQLADYLEQAIAYSQALDVPVFLAPVMTELSPSGLYTGGHRLTALSALTIFGGRSNVGVLAIQRRTHPYTRKVETECFMILRGGLFWDRRNQFNPQRLQMVRSTGSAREREDIKVWR